jgi:hypothetical protein
VRRIDQPLGHRKTNRGLHRATQVAREVDPFDDDEQVRVLGEDRRASAFGSVAPTVARGAARPAGGTAWLVAQVGGDDQRIVAVAPGEEGPVGDPNRLGVGRRVPERISIVVAAAPIGVAGVIVEEDRQPRSGQRGNRPVEDGERRQVGERWVRGDGGGWGRRVFGNQLVREGEADTIGAERADRGDNSLERLAVEAADDEVGAFRAIPVDTTQADGPAVPVEKGRAAGAKRRPKRLRRYDAPSRPQLGRW